MDINRNKPSRWKADIAESVDLYNDWFLTFAPSAFRETRLQTTKDVEATLRATDNLADVRPEVLRENPGVLRALRMSTCPPLARDRLINLAGVSKSLVERMEKDGKLPAQMGGRKLGTELRKIGKLIAQLADRDLFTWLDGGKAPSQKEIERAAMIVADRLCGSTTDPIIRNAQEDRQLEKIGAWLKRRGYRLLVSGIGTKFDEMPLGSYCFRLNVPAKPNETSDRLVNIPVDAVVMRKTSKAGDLPILIEAKSAGDFTNVNKRRKEEGMKMQQLRVTYGEGVEYILFLCGYFDSGYLGYEAAEGIDWVWEHRIDDLAELGL